MLRYKFFCFLLLTLISVGQSLEVVAQQVSSGAFGWRANTPERVAIRIEVEAFLIEYYYRIDHGEAEKVADMFTENATLHIFGKEPLTGREAIREHYAKRSKSISTRHVSGNLRITFVDESRVQTSRVITYYHSELSADGSLGPAIPAVVEYTEDLERGADGQWYFSLRVAAPLFTFHD